MTSLNKLVERANDALADEYRAMLRRMLDNRPCYFRVTDWGVVKLTPKQYLHEITPEILAKPRPRNKSIRDWRMALRRKLNGDTR